MTMREELTNKCRHYLQLMMPKFKTKSNVRLHVIVPSVADFKKCANLPSWYKDDFSITSLEKEPTPNLYAILLEYEFWKDASDLVLKGILAHELTHLEYKMNIAPLNLFSAYNNAFTYNCLEYIINYTTMAKGYVLETIAYRKYVLDKAGIRIGVPEYNNFIDTFKRSIEFENMTSTQSTYNFNPIKDVYGDAYTNLIHRHL